MLVDQLLLSFRFDHDGEVVKSLNQSANLEPVDQIHDYWNVVLANLIQEIILNIDRFTCGHSFAPRRNPIYATVLPVYGCETLSNIFNSLACLFPGFSNVQAGR